MSMKNIALGRWSENVGQKLHCSECGGTIMNGLTVEAFEGEQPRERPNIIPSSMRFLSDKDHAAVSHMPFKDDSVFIFFRCQVCKQMLMLLIKQENNQLFMSIGLATGDEEEKNKLTK